MHRHDHDRPASLLSLSSTYNSNTDDHHHDHHHDDNHKQPLPLSAFQPSRQSSVASDHSCGGMSDDEMRGLWRCMLQLQDRYCCYKSTRMDLALSAGDEDGEFMRGLAWTDPGHGVCVCVCVC